MFFQIMEEYLSDIYFLINLEMEIKKICKIEWEKILDEIKKKNKRVVLYFRTF